MPERAGAGGGRGGVKSVARLFWVTVVATVAASPLLSLTFP